MLFRSRSPAKVEAAVSKLIKENSAYSKISLSSKAPGKIKAKSKIPDPTISGMKYSELKQILSNEKVVIPVEHSGTDKEEEMDLLNLFLGNHSSISNGLQSNWDTSSAGGFLYSKIGLNLMPYDLVKFDKLPAAQAKYFKRLILSPNGQKFIAHFNRLKNAEK